MCLEVYGFPKKKKVSIYKPLDSKMINDLQMNENSIPIIKKNQDVKIKSISDHNHKVLEEKKKRKLEKEKKQKKKRRKTKNLKTVLSFK